MVDHVRQKSQEFRALKNDVKMEMYKENQMILEDKKQEVNKQREIRKIINAEQKTELGRNIQAFIHLNNEERELRKELCDKQTELFFKEKYLKRVNVRH